MPPKTAFRPFDLPSCLAAYAQAAFIRSLCLRARTGTLEEKKHPAFLASLVQSRLLRYFAPRSKRFILRFLASSIQSSLLGYFAPLTRCFGKVPQQKSHGMFRSSLITQVPVQDLKSEILLEDSLSASRQRWRNKETAMRALLISGHHLRSEL